MREYELEVLDQYHMEVISTRKIRGAFFIDTNEGTMLLRETDISDRRVPLLWQIWRVCTRSCVGSRNAKSRERPECRLCVKMWKDVGRNRSLCVKMRKGAGQNRGLRRMGKCIRRRGGICWKSSSAITAN